jgi:hypothetical protein
MRERRAGISLASLVSRSACSAGQLGQLGQPVSLVSRSAWSAGQSSVVSRQSSVITMEPAGKWAERPADVCFIVPSYKSRETIGATLDSIHAQKTARSFETLVVDSSGDDTAIWLEALHPETRVIVAHQRLFPGAARNLGAQRTSAEFLAFVDADVTLTPDWLDTLLARFSDPAVVLVSGSVANANPESAASRVLYWIEFSQYLPGLPSGFRPTVSSSNLLTRRRDFQSRGGFDEAYHMAEDLLLCSRWREGLYFEAGARAFHRHRTRWLAVFRHLGELGFWSGTLRRQHSVSGGWLRDWPTLSAGLPPARTALIVGRVLRHDGGEGLMAAALSPALFVGLTRWSWGFYRGLRAEPASPAGQPGSPTRRTGS